MKLDGNDSTMTVIIAGLTIVIIVCVGINVLQTVAPMMEKQVTESCAKDFNGSFNGTHCVLPNSTAITFKMLKGIWCVKNECTEAISWTRNKS